MSIKCGDKDNEERESNNNYRIEDYLLYFVVAFIFCVVILQIFTRFVVRSSLPWTEEITRYVLIWLTYLGFTHHVRNDSHARMKAFINLFPDKIIKASEIFANLIFLLVTLVLTWQGIKHVIVQFSTGRMASSFPLPVYVFSIAIPICFLFSSFFLIRRIWRIR